MFVVQIVEKAAKQFYKELKTEVLKRDFVAACWDKPYREIQYVAIEYLVAHKKKLVLADLPRLKKLAQTKSWWDSIDGLDKLRWQNCFGQSRGQAGDD